MQNGTYIVKSNFLNTSCKLVAYNGSLKFYSHNNQFLRTVNKKFLDEFFEIGERTNGTNGVYDIAYRMNGRIVERIKLMASYPVAKYKIAQLKAQRNYSSGLLQPLRCNI